MKLLTKALRERLLKNGRNRDRDHSPVLKLFNPCGAATWLISELDEDGETMFGLADLGFGTPELGLPVPHKCSLDFMKPLRYRGHHGDSESG